MVGRRFYASAAVLVWDMVSGAMVSVGIANRIPMRSGEKVYT